MGCQGERRASGTIYLTTRSKLLICTLLTYRQTIDYFPLVPPLPWGPSRGESDPSPGGFLVGSLLIIIPVSTLLVPCEYSMSTHPMSTSL
jgi:hypothetical protein